jgi:uncharacterized protein (TIGR03084 family)
VTLDYSALCDDLAAEQDALDRMVASLDDRGWGTATPAPGWTVRDQIGHLAYYDEAGALAARDPDGFRADDARVPRARREQDQLTLGRALAGGDVLRWWRQARGGMLDAFRRLDARARLPWYGPDMSAASFVTARLEETWGHGQDVADALGVTWTDTERLRHVAHLGVITRGYSFVNQGHEAPRDDVRVELTSGTGASWSWGDERAVNRVRGPARDFCLVVTRRRHVADTDLLVEGAVAHAWMTIAQAFAGPPGDGRKPGQFRRR